MEIANKVRDVRNALGWTKQKFADEIRVSSSYISQIEKGDKMPSDALLDLIMQKFNVSEDWWEVGEGPIFKAKEKPEIPEHLRLLFKQIEKVFPDSSSLIEKNDLLSKVLKDLRDDS